MSLLRWDPRDELATMRDEMMRFMEENMTPRRVMQRFRPDTTFRLPLDAYVTDNEVVIVAAIPGVKPEDVEITFEDDTLTIKGEICGPLENVEYVFQERPCGKFGRSIIVNIPVKTEEAEAKFENGLLTLTLPKAEEAKPKVIKINAK
ncbi:MAG TPA: Hsp20/alpha crystallin family protein [Anaerolineae bacterium]|nr:Hsp20/alpha crystallin family protein [Anaerolineae bacterium]